jgi:hypothetical protein
MRRFVRSFRPIWCVAQRFWDFDVLKRSGCGGVLVVVLICSMSGCIGMPPLEEQERHVRDKKLVLHQLTPRAFVGAWGMPTYQQNLREGGRSVWKPAMHCSWLIQITGGWWYFLRNGLSIAKPWLQLTSMRWAAVGSVKRSFAPD